MNVGDERNFGYAFTNLFQRNRGVVVGNGEADDLTPGATISSICATVAPTSDVSVLVIDWMTTGAPPPI